MPVSPTSTGHISDVGVRGRNHGMQQGLQASDTPGRVLQILQSWNRGRQEIIGVSRKAGEYKI